jgi:hypothetical protein
MSGGITADHGLEARDAGYHATKVNSISTLSTVTRSPFLSSVLAVKG